MQEILKSEFNEYVDYIRNWGRQRIVSENAFETASEEIKLK